MAFSGASQPTLRQRRIALGLMSLVTMHSLPKACLLVDIKLLGWMSFPSGYFLLFLAPTSCLGQQVNEGWNFDGVSFIPNMAVPFFVPLKAGFAQTADAPAPGWRLP